MSDAPPRNTSSATRAPSVPASASPKTPGSPGPAAPPAPSTDVVLLGPPTADGAGVHVIRARDAQIETGELRALAEGKPITGEIVSLRPRESNARICDVTESYTPAGAQGAPLGHKGPA